MTTITVQPEIAKEITLEAQRRQMSIDDVANEWLRHRIEKEDESKKRELNRKVSRVLKESRDIEKLGNAVREAEHLCVTGEADEELKESLTIARRQWDEMRESHGQITTKGRQGGVADRAEAVDDLNALIIANQLTVWDQKLDTNRKTSDVLAEVRRDWEKISGEAVEKEIETAQQNIPHYLDLAKKKFKDAYNLSFYSRKEKLKSESERKPTGFAFHENDRAKLNEWLSKVEEMIARRDKAEQLVEQSYQEPNPFEILSMLKQARDVWQHSEGIDERIREQQRIVTAYYLSSNNASDGNISEIIRGIADENIRAEVAYQKGIEIVDDGKWNDGLALLEESLAVYRQSENLNALANALYQIARTHHLLGNLDKARTHYYDALRLYKRVDKRNGIAACKLGLGRLAIQSNSVLPNAIEDLNEAQQIYAELGDKQQIANVQEVLNLANQIKERQLP